MRLLSLSCAALLVASVVVAADKKDKLKSGLQPGDKAGAFQSLDCTGENAGKKLCYR